MPPIDPQQLLNALGQLLTNHGGIKGAQEASRIASLMKSATKLVSRCIYLNILKVTDSPDALSKFIEVGGWDILNDWLDFSRESNQSLLKELLEVYLNLPVTVSLLKQNSAAKTIKQLCKTDDEKVKALSGQLVDLWTKTIRGQSTKEENDDKNKKDRHKKREKDEKDKENDKKETKENDKKETKEIDMKETKEKDSDKHKKSEKDSERHRKDHHHKDRRDRDRHKEKDREKEKSRDKTKSSNDNSKDSTKSSSSSDHSSSSSSKKDSSSSISSSKRLSPPQESKSLSSSSLTTSSVAPSSKKDDPSYKEDESRKRPKTVKLLNTRFRSTGLLDNDNDDDETELAKKKQDKVPVKRTGLELKEEQTEKKPRLLLTMPTLTPANMDPPTITTPPEVTHGKIKIIPAPKRAPPHEIVESNVFMDSLQKSKYTYGGIKKKKKMTSPQSLTPPSLLRGTSLTSNSAMSPPSGTSPPSASSPPGATTEENGPTSPTLLSPTSAMARRLPSVPSFYRDTLEDTPEPSDDKKEKEEVDDSPPVIESMELTTILPPSQDQSDADSGRGSTESNSGESKEGSTDGNEKEFIPEVNHPRSKSGKPKKSVSWVADSELEQHFFFELDETERVNVNRPKSFLEMKREEMMLDRRAMESAKRYINDVMVEVLPWRRPKLIDNVIETVEIGCNSKEKAVQTDRERAVLCALFFNKVPDTPNEPDADMSNADSDMKEIPLEDENGSCVEYEHTYSNLEDPSSLPYDPEFGDLPFQSQGPPMNPGLMGMNTMNGRDGGNMGFGSLPPALNHLLNTLHQQAQETRDPVMQNLQSMLSGVLQNTNPQDSGMLMERILSALDHFKNQIPGLGSLINSVMNNGMDPGIGGPGPRGMGPSQMGNPRHGILGTHPPGFMGNSMRPNMPGGPNMHGGPNLQGGPNMQGSGMVDINPNYYNKRGPGPNMDEMRMGGPGPGGPPPHKWRGGGRGRPYNKRNHKRTVCQYFVKTGTCRYGDGCQFFHPMPDS